MIPKISPLLLRVLSPIKPLRRPKPTVSPGASTEGGEGGYGPPSHTEEETQEKSADAVASPSLPSGEPNKSEEDEAEKKSSDATLAFQPGLTRLILDLQGHKVPGTPVSARRSYEKDSARTKDSSVGPVKGSRVDKKAG